MRLLPLSTIVGLAGLGGALAVSFFSSSSDPFGRFSYAYLTNFCFFASITLGALFFVLIQHVTKSGWSVTVRRIAEMLAACILPLGVLFLPIALPVLLSYDGLYKWNSSAWGDANYVHEGKSPYLNNVFFFGRAIVYFTIWIALALYMYRRSLRQDKSGDYRLSSRMQALSGPALILFAATVVFASFDWEMSLSPMWYSTMFPVYFFAGAVLSGLATITLVALLLQRSGRVTDEIRVEHYHDLAKLTFAFIFFWGYIAFGQFMLIWYANIPEETFWFEIRFSPGWKAWSILLLVGHFFIAFAGMMARSVRRSKRYLLGASIFLLAMHWVDHVWVVMPAFLASDEAISSPFVLGLVEVLALIGMTGLYTASFCVVAGDRALVPLADPRLAEALNYENA